MQLSLNSLLHFPKKKLSSEHHFDVLVIYEDLAKSASDENYLENNPFPLSEDYFSYNFPYAYLIERAHDAGLEIGFSTVEDIVGAGKVKSYWAYSGKEWKREKQSAYSNFIYLKCPPKNVKHKKALDLLFSKSDIKSFSERQILRFFRNKLETYELFPEFTIPTVKVDKLTEDNLRSAQKKLASILSEHPHKEDFGEELVLKDNFGSGGISVFKFSPESTFEKIQAIAEKENETGEEVFFILQPLLKYENGIVIGPHSGMIDLRLWMINEKVLNTSIRVVREGEFRANLHQGGKEFFIDRDDVPTVVFDQALYIRQRLEIQNSFYALDFLRSDNGNVYFIEGNSSPGIDWMVGDTVHEKRQKETIDTLIKLFRSKTNHILPLQKS